MPRLPPVTRATGFGSTVDPSFAGASAAHYNCNAPAEATDERSRISETHLPRCRARSRSLREEPGRDDAVSETNAHAAGSRRPRRVCQPLQTRLTQTALFQELPASNSHTLHRWALTVDACLTTF